jgi:Zn-finger nucleic acid-binding protein
MSGLEQVLSAPRERPLGDRRCPRCTHKMDLVKIESDPVIEIDRCPEGEGVWLDAGELAAIVKTYSDQKDRAIAEFLGDLFRHELTGKTEDS